ncbi:deoxyribodipyrimidine photo-lyase type I domain protein [Burkholderia pseudomallei]|nr:deoxyribodipyrimidine photo-lyase type I domain protein [Burkholderia pseudomallei]
MKIRKYGAASAPQPATHCQFAAFDAASASTSVSQNHASPARQSISKCLTRNEAHTIRTRLCIQPVAQSSRMPASTNG